jgi:haloacetate dehalogenase
VSLFSDEFSADTITVGDSKIFVRRGGTGPAILLLHGFPQTHVAWHRVAPRLAHRFTVIVPDLPGYGDSTGPEPDARHERYSKRSIAATFVELMERLGEERFAVIGHDRGARVAYRMALDHPERVRALAVLDVIPTLDVAERLTYDLAREMANWFWLATSSPVPERLIAAEPDTYLRYIIHAWQGTDAIAPEALAAYARCFRTPRVITGMCEDYRAGDSIDLEHDRRDRDVGRRIACPILVLWPEGGLTARFGDPLAIWRQWSYDVSGDALRGGHFMMEESPEQVTSRLERFLGVGSVSPR